MWRCKKCGTENSDNANFCAGCGKPNPSAPKGRGQKEAGSRKSLFGNVYFALGMSALLLSVVALLFGFKQYHLKNYVQMPDAVRQPIVEVQRSLEEAGLQVSLVYEESETVAEDCVISQSVPAGTEIKVGSSVTLTVSTGLPPVTVPGVGGKTLEEAEALLTEAGLAVASERDWSALSPEERVIGQSVTPGETVTPGSEVTITLSTRSPFADWSDIVAIDGAYGILAGLKSDGSVVAVNGDGPVELSGWDHVKKISARLGSVFGLLGLKEDGTVLSYPSAEEMYQYAEYECTSKISDWKNIVDIATSGHHAVGVRSDGRVEYYGMTNEPGELDKYSAWRGVKSVSAGVCPAFYYTLGCTDSGVLMSFDSNWNSHLSFKSVSSDGFLTVGVKADGTVYYSGLDADWYAEELSQWRDIKQVCISDGAVVGLQNSGTLVFAGYTDCEAAHAWTDVDRILLLSEGYDPILIGFKTDGSVLAASEDGELDCSGLKNVVDMKLYNGLLVALTQDGTIQCLDY